MIENEGEAGYSIEMEGVQSIPVLGEFLGKLTEPQLRQNYLRTARTPPAPVQALHHADEPHEILEMKGALTGRLAPKLV